jgi:uncharacterized Zn ribbon protein
MSEEKTPCPVCNSQSTYELSGSLHCQDCGNDAHIESTLSGTPMNARRKNIAANPLQIGVDTQEEK